MNTSTKPRLKKRRYRRAPLRNREPRNIIIIGTTKTSRDLGYLLSTTDLKVLYAKTEAEALLMETSQTQAYVVVDPVKERSVITICRRLIQAIMGGKTPLFVVLSTPRPAFAERALLKMGVSAVFHQPRRRGDLVKTVSSIAKGSFSESAEAMSSEDQELQQRICERLEAEKAVFGKGLEVRVSGGRVALKGQLNALWKIKFLEDLVGTIKGVQTVSSAGIDLRLKSSRDRWIERQARRLIKAVTNLDTQTLEFTSHGGSLRVTGTAISHSEVQRAQKLLSRLSYLKRVLVKMNLSVSEVEKDRELAKRLDAMLLNTVHTSVHGGTVVLKGRVPRMRDAIEASRLAEPLNGVESVENKLLVSSL